MYKVLDSLLWILLPIAAFFMHRYLRIVHARSSGMVIWALIQVQYYFTQME